MLKDNQKPDVGTCYKGNLIQFFSSIHYLFRTIGIQKHTLINN